MTVIEELTRARDDLRAKRPGPAASAEKLVDDLEHMWADTEFMPLTRATLDGTTQHSVIDIASEIEALITRLHSINLDRAGRIAANLITFRADPTHDNLRRIWIR